MLTSDGCYVPPKESIRVIKSRQSLKAFLLDPTGSSSKEDLSHVAETNKKRKNRSAETEKEFTSSTPNLPKRSKCKNITRNEATYVDAPSIKSATNGLDNKDQTNLLTESLIQDDPKPSDISCVETTKSATITTESSTLNQSNRTTRNLSSFNKQSVSNNHILYKDDEEEENVPTNGTPVEQNLQSEIVAPEVEFRSHLMELDPNSVRIFKLPRKQETIKIIEEIVIPAKAPAPEQKEEQTHLDESVEAATRPNKADFEDKTTTPLTSTKLDLELSLKEQESKDKSQIEEPMQSLLDSDSDIMVLDDTNLDDSDSDVEAVPVKDESLDIIRDMLQNAAPLESLPNVGETIIFKLAKKKGAQQPTTVTDNIAGTCSYVNRRTTSITISVIGKYNIKTRKTI